MGGTLRGFGIAAAIGAAIYGAAVLVASGFSVVSIVIALACVLGGWFWIVLLTALADMYDWLQLLALRGPQRESSASRSATRESAPRP